MVLIAEGAFGSAWPPYFLSFINRRDEASVLFGKIFKYTVVGYGFFVLLFFILAEPIVIIMTAPAFHSAYTVVGFIAAACVLKVCYLIMLPGFYFEKKLYVQTGIEWMAAVIALIFYFSLIPLFHKEGAAIATMLTYLSLPILAHLIGRKYLPVHYEWKSIRMFLCGLVSLAGLTFIPFTNYLFIKVIVNSVFFIVFAFFTYFFVLTREEKETILQGYFRLRRIPLFVKR
jgi:O-antigen/teichoic acid export membrane protein